MQPQYTDDTVIYLLLNPDGRGAIGFYDQGSGKVFNVAFTSTDKVSAFIKKARKIGIPGFESIEKVAPSSVGEFFRWKKEGKIKGELAIDLAPEELEHPVFARMADGLN